MASLNIHKYQYSSKFSPKKYTQRQHCATLVLKKRMKGIPYCDVEEILSEMPKTQRVLGLNDIPCYSSVQKFFNRICES